MALSYNEIAGRSVEPLGSLSDGVFAFAMTLLVLDLRVPVLEGFHSESGLQHALAGFGTEPLDLLAELHDTRDFLGRTTHAAQQTQAFRARPDVDSPSVLAGRDDGAIFDQTIGGFHNLSDADFHLLAQHPRPWRNAVLELGLRFESTSRQERADLSIGFIILVQLDYVIAPRLWVLRRI
jgi:transmembrane protein TMEM174 (potassium channel)